MRGFEKFNQNNTIYLLMFGYVQSARWLMPSVPVSKILEKFMEEFEVSHDHYNIETLRSQYNRMQKDFLKKSRA